VTARSDAGSVTVGGILTIGLNNTGRWSLMDVNGGTLTVNDTNTGISLGATNAGNAALLLRAGTVTASIITMGGPAANAYTAGATAEIEQTSGTLYLGGGGIVQPQTANVSSIIQLNDGTLVATAPWTSTIAGDGATVGFLIGASTSDTYTIQAANASGTAENITLTGEVGGSGNLVKTGAGSLTLSGGSMWTGTTTVSNGSLVLGGNALFDTSSVNIVSPGNVDATAAADNGTADGTLHLGDGTVGESVQSLTGNGTVIGNVCIGSGGTLAPGTGAASFGNLTINGSLTNFGAIILKVDHPPTGVINDEVTAQYITNLADYSPTLTVTNPTYDLQTGDTFKLFNIASGYTTYTNNLAITLPATSPDNTITYEWNTNNLPVNGTITVAQGAVNTTPTNMTFSVSGKVLTICWPASQTGWTLQYTTSLASPITWTTYPGSTNVNCESITIPASGTMFYRLYYVIP
jgi:autotransporter-associated beta strand protein